VYRGQGLSKSDFDKLMKKKVSLCHLTISCQQLQRENLYSIVLKSNKDNPEIIEILFEIILNPSISSTHFPYTRYSQIIEVKTKWF
jgi:hypothetical protein